MSSIIDIVAVDIIALPDQLASSTNIVTVDNKPKKARTIIAELIKQLEGKHNLVHVANCENIRSVEYVLNSLVTPPGALICSGHWFVEEEEEVREIAQRLIPDIKLIMVPSDLNIEADDKKQATVDYLTEQLDAWKSGKEE